MIPDPVDSLRGTAPEWPVMDCPVGILGVALPALDRAVFLRLAPSVNDRVDRARELDPVDPLAASADELHGAGVDTERRPVPLADASRNQPCENRLAPAEAAGAQSAVRRHPKEPFAMPGLEDDFGRLLAHPDRQCQADAARHGVRHGDRALRHSYTRGPRGRAPADAETPRLPAGRARALAPRAGERSAAASRC